MYQFFLALVFMTELGITAPKFSDPVMAYTTLDACLSQALKYNKLDPKLREDDNWRRGAHYVCLQLVSPV